MAQMDSHTNRIKELDKLLEPFIGKDKRIIKTEIARLTVAGDNYGSLMLSVNLYIHDDEVLHLVAKLCPPNEILKEILNSSSSFRKETIFYNTILPKIKEFLAQRGFPDAADVFPKCFGARISLNSDLVDDDAVILLENLKMAGFGVLDRMKGMSLEEAAVFVNDLAVLHAVPIAIKLSDPESFWRKIGHHLSRNDVFDSVSGFAEKNLIESTIKAIRIKDECLPFLENIEKTLKMCLNNIKSDTKPSEPFATINHNDYWVNNLMVMKEDGKIVKSKIVDFQVIDYGSPGNDIVFFLFSSVQMDVLKQHYDYLIRVYYDKFVGTLKELNCDTTRFTFEQLQEEIGTAAKTKQFFHIMLMLKHILAVKDKVKELSEMTAEDMLSEVQNSEEYKIKVPEVAFEFIKQKWIY